MGTKTYLYNHLNVTLIYLRSQLQSCIGEMPTTFPFILISEIIFFSQLKA